MLEVVDLLRHEGPEQYCDGSKAELGAEYGTVRPASVDVTCVVDDDKGHKWSDTVGYTNTAGEEPAQRQWGNLS